MDDDGGLQWYQELGQQQEMEMTQESITKVCAKLQNARMQLQSAKLKKSGHNKFAGYTYFELGDFLAPTQEIFHSLGLCGIVSFGNELATLTITDLESGQQVLITSPMSSAALKGCHEVQNLGAVQTYLRRYLWVAAMEIVEHDAIDSTTGKDAPKSSKSVPKAAMDDMPPDEQNRLQGIAMDVLAAFEESDQAGMAAYVGAKSTMSADEQVAFWHCFDSKTRSYIKKLGTTATELANTP